MSSFLYSQTCVETFLEQTGDVGNRLLELLVLGGKIRGKDVFSIAGRSQDDDEIEQKLSDAFCKELDLKDEDLAILFASEEDDDAE